MYQHPKKEICCTDPKKEICCIDYITIYWCINIQRKRSAALTISLLTGVSTSQERDLLHWLHHDLLMYQYPEKEICCIDYITIYIYINILRKRSDALTTSRFTDVSTSQERDLLHWLHHNLSIYQHPEKEICCIDYITIYLYINIPRKRSAALTTSRLTDVSTSQERYLSFVLRFDNG